MLVNDAIECAQRAGYVVVSGDVFWSAILALHDLTDYSSQSAHEWVHDLMRSANNGLGYYETDHIKISELRGTG